MVSYELNRIIILLSIILSFFFKIDLSLAQVQFDSSFRLQTNGEVLFEENFENSPAWLGAGTQFPETHSFSTIQSPVFRGKFSGRFELRFGDDKSTPSGLRSEVLVPSTNHSEKWYSFAVYFPSEGWELDKDEELFTQWHTGGNPVLSYRIINGNFRFRIGHGTKLSPIWTRYDFEQITKDKWIEFVFHIIHSKNSDGLVEIWRDGKLILTHKGPNMYSDDSKLPYWKLGIYKWAWASRETNVSKRITYFDNIKVGDQNSRLEDFINSISPDPPILVSPFNETGGVTLSPILQWKNRDSNANYHLQVSESNGFENIFLDIKSIPTNSFKVSNLEIGKKYYWRVRALNQMGESEWSPTWSFTTTLNATKNDLIGFWKMEEGRGNKLYDHSGNSNDGLFINPELKSPQWFEGKDGFALSLNPREGGNINIINHSASQVFDNSITIAAWVMPKDSGNRAIFSKGNSDGFILMRNNDGRFFFSIKTSSSNSPINLMSKQSYGNNTWVHVAVTFTGNKITLYINGKEEINASFDEGRISNNIQNMEIGSILGSNRWIGDIDELRLYNRALSALEILDIYENQPESEKESIPVSGISVSPTTHSLALEKTIQLNVTVSPSNATNKTIFWTSSNPEIATVNSDGLVTGVSLGKTTVTAKTQDGDFASSSTITVIESNNDLLIESFTLLDGGSNTVIQALTNGDRLVYDQVKNTRLNVRANPNTNQIKSVFISLEGPVNFSRTDNGFTFELLNNSGLNLPIGDYKLIAIPYSEQNREGLKGMETSIEFSIVESQDEQSLRVENFTVIDSNDNQDFFELFDGMEIDLDLIQDLNLNIRANTNPPNIGSVYISITGPTNHSATENVAPYSLFGDINGDYLGRALAAGDYTLEAVPFEEANKGGIMGESISIKFSVAEVEEITLPDVPNLVTPLNNSIDLTNTIDFQWNEINNATSFRIQISEKSDFSTVFFNQDKLINNHIKISNLKSGTQYYWRVFASNEAGNSDWSTTWSFKTKTVSNVVLASGISMTPTDTIMEIGSNLQLQAIVLPSNATNKKVNWSTSDANIAIVDDQGIVTALKTGEVTITVKTEEGDFIAQATITIFDPRENYKVERFLLLDAVTNTEKEEIVDGTKLEYEKIKDLLLNFRIKVDPFEVGSVYIALDGPINSSRVDNGYEYDLLNNDGLYLPIGNYTLTAIPYSEINRGGVQGIKKSISFSIEPPENIPVTGISMDPLTATLEKGEMLQFTATISPSDASNKNINWLSSDPLIASVNENGLVSAISQGTVTITAISQEGNIQGNASLMVTDTQETLGIAGFTLINADTDKDMYTLSNGAELDINQIQDINLTIRVNTNPPTVGSVHLVLKGPVNETRIENGLPYELFGYDNGDYFGKKFALGEYTLQATPYSEKDTFGVKGTSEIIKFFVVEPSIEKAPNTPILISPVDLSADLDNSLTFLWEKMEDAENYSIQISEKSDFSSLFLNKELLTDNQIDVEGLLSGITYFWRVNASNQIGKSDWSEIWSFTIKEKIIPPGKPTLLGPENLSTGLTGTITLKWTKPENAAVYRVQIAKDQDFVRIQFDLYNIPTESFDINNLEAGTTFYWRVNASNEGGSSEFSETWKFETLNGPDAPNLVSPQDSQTNLDTDLNLVWDSVLGADSYRLQVSGSRDFSQRMVDQSGITENSFALEKLEEGKTYYWRVRAVNKAGSSVYSDIWNFTTKVSLLAPTAPELVSPVQSATVNASNVDFEWKPVNTAEKYLIQVSKFSNFSQEIVVNNSAVIGNTINITTLEPDQIYFWRVRAINAAGSSPYTAVWLFKTEPLPPLATPLLISPKNGIKLDTTSITLNWEIVEEAENYQLEVSKDSTFQEGLMQFKELSYTNYILDSLERGKKYFWRVQANGKRPSSQSEIWSFTIEEDQAVLLAKSAPVKIKTYPNPFDDILHLEFSKTIEGEVIIIISDNKGIPVFEALVSDIKESLTLNIPSDWPKGVYILRVQGFGLLESKKIIKN